MAPSEHVVQDYASTSLSLKAHPVSFVRQELRLLHVLSTEEITAVKNGTNVKAAGLVTVRQKPGTAKGVCFITLEDETGFSNLAVFKDLFEKYRKEILHAKLLMVEGKPQRESGVTHIIVARCEDGSKLLRKLTPAANDDLPVLTLSRSDEKTDHPYPNEVKKRPVQEAEPKAIFPAARNFK